MNDTVWKKACYKGRIFAHWNFTFVDNIKKDYSPTGIYVDYCDAVFTSYCRQIQKITNVSLSGNSLNFSQKVGWGYHFYFKVRVSYTDERKRNLNCHFWPKSNCYTCKGYKNNSCADTIDLYRSSAGGGKVV
uniref:Gnk2-homologous domain-containing protein n=1 Tax=Parastrongyloides trichosuri TaxID=131310 RepID=A0A0N5A716_PARTI